MYNRQYSSLSFRYLLEFHVSFSQGREGIIKLWDLNATTSTPVLTVPSTDVGFCRASFCEGIYKYLCLLSFFLSFYECIIICVPYTVRGDFKCLTEKYCDTVVHHDFII